MTYSTFVKQTLMDSIHELSQTPENYAVHPVTDFTRNRKIGFKDFLLLLLTMEDDCLREELYLFFVVQKMRQQRQPFIISVRNSKMMHYGVCCKFLIRILNLLYTRINIASSHVMDLLPISSVMRTIKTLILNQTTSLQEVLIKFMPMHFIPY